MQENKLNLVLCWHMHQPQYRSESIYTRPWTWLHAIKDYSDMAAHIETVPGARAVVNFSPHLMVQIEDYARLVRRFIDLGEVIGDRILDALRQKVADALMGFEGQGLTVTRKDGKVYVSLDEKLLFKSGSTVVDPNGVCALKQLAVVLAKNPDIDIMIEGHTDDVPFRKGSTVKDNWDLSVLRATSIVRILLDGSGIEPTRLTVAGRGEFLPVDSGQTTEARRKNRRTEIILSPDLSEVFKILEL